MLQTEIQMIMQSSVVLWKQESRHLELITTMCWISCCSDHTRASAIQAPPQHADLYPSMPSTRDGGLWRWRPFLLPLMHEHYLFNIPGLADLIYHAALFLHYFDLRLSTFLFQMNELRRPQSGPRGEWYVSLSNVQQCMLLSLLKSQGLLKVSQGDGLRIIIL